MKKTKNDSEYLNNLRHSCAHLLAAAVMELWPKAKRTIGPAIDNGFYFDFDFGDIKISESNFRNIEAKMKQLLPTWEKFSGKEVSAKEARDAYKDNEYKKELIEEFSGEGQKLTFYYSGDYFDLCRGGHIENPKEELKHFKLLKVAGAYWRGNEKNKMLTRIYGTCFPTQEELDLYLQNLAEAEKRDHRKIGQELELFSTNALTGPGLILWHPKLAVIRNIVEQFWKDEHYKNGYQLVFTPHIASMDMFVKSRHLSKYIDFMFPIMFHDYIEGESAPDYHQEEVLKPMNCPNHIQIYKTRPRSYRELPIRMGELGTVYRYERAGVLHGMTRVRGFTQDDSHIFCRPDQAKEEVRNILNLTKHLYEVFGFKEYHAYVATKPEKSLGENSKWEFAQNVLKDVLKEENIPFDVDEGGGAFYGPKIDSKIKDSLGREWQLGTIQFDFNQPDNAKTTKEDIEEFWQLKAFKSIFKTKEKAIKYLEKLGRGFDVNFVNKEGKEEQVVMVHRTIFGSMERFFGILIEHYAGAFPTWLAPVQVQIIPIADRHLKYANDVKKLLEEKNIRVEIDERSETMQAKIRDAQFQKVPYMLIVGDREEKEKKVAVRVRDKGDVGQISIESFKNRLLEEINSKSLTLFA
ncbi:threonine--tRNA ligase [Candidatus Gottesmanbacteria bacterium]|nr:threonine--tRNA ligase [Candidatus Gottesmanbacteria bacterium]